MRIHSVLLIALVASACALATARGMHKKGTMKSPTAKGEISLKGGETRASSVYDKARSESARAVDGNTNGVYTKNSCFHSGHDDKAWWSVKMKSKQCVQKVTVWNRQDCCQDRLRDAVVRIGNNDPAKADNPVCGKITSQMIKKGLQIDVVCKKPLNGRYISVHLPSKEYLQICEVTAYSGDKCDKDDGGDDDKGCGNKFPLSNDGNCYFLDKTDKTFEEAEAECKSRGGHVTSIQSKAENDFIFKLAKKADKKIWIGIHDRKKQEKKGDQMFEWTDGSGKKYTNWAPGEPNDYGSGEDCTHIYEKGQHPGKWNDLKCSNKIGTICKKADGMAPVKKPCTCSAWGDPHFTTCDGKRFDYMGKCVYTTAETCGSSAERFKIEEKHQPYNRNPRAATTKELYIHLYDPNKDGKYDVKISFLQGRQFEIDGERTNSPYTGDGFEVFLEGGQLVLSTDFDLVVYWNGVYNWKVNIPGEFRNQICGLCGKWDNDQSNDFTLKDGSKTNDVNKFGNSWVAYGYGCPGEQPPEGEGPDDPCKRTGFQKQAAEKCEILMNKKGPLSACFGVKPHEEAFKACQKDLCLAKEVDTTSTQMDKLMCDDVSEFVDQCMRSGVGLKSWRTAKFCPKQCGKNQVYNANMLPCQETCTGVPKKCSNEPRVEGCQCKEGYILSGENCVENDGKKCGCKDDRGKYLQEFAAKANHLLFIMESEATDDESIFRVVATIFILYVAAHIGAHIAPAQPGNANANRARGGRGNEEGNHGNRRNRNRIRASDGNDKIKVKRVNVLILGAGAAGLWAAQCFLKKGFDDFLVLEGEAHPGGRVHDIEFAGIRIEKGANWVVPVCQKLIRLVKKVGLKTHIIDADNMVAKNSRGKSIPKDRVKGRLGTLKKVMDKVLEYRSKLIDESRPDISQREALTMNGWKPRSLLDKALEWFVCDFEWQDPPEVTSLKSTVSFDTDDGWFVTDQRGFKSIFSDIINYLTNSRRMCLNKRVTTIDQSNGKEVYVTCVDGSIYCADYVLSTFSLGVLQHKLVNFLPSLPKWKTDVIDTNRMGSFTKVFAKFPTKFWEDEEWILHVSNRAGYFPCFLNLGARGVLPTGTNILVGFLVGDEAQRVEEQSLDKTKAEIWSIMKKLYSSELQEIPEPTDVYVTDWSKNPLQMGAFSCPPYDMTTTMVHEMQASVGRVHFGGEATDDLYSGYVVGAIRSGEREASKIMERMESKHSAIKRERPPAELIARAN